MLLKLSHLTHLADARYGAALGVSYLAFTQERGSLYKLPLGAVAEIWPWVAGAQGVLAYGADLEGTQEAEAQALAEQLGLLIEFQPSQGDRPPAENYALQVNLGSLIPAGTAALNPVYLEALPGPEPDELPRQLQALAAAWPGVPVLLAADDLLSWPASLQQASLQVVQGASYGRKLPGSLTQLDYDGFEALLAALEALGLHN